MNLQVVCSHKRGREFIRLCCVSEVENGQAVAFQIDAVLIEVTDEPDDDSHLFPSTQAAIEHLQRADWPHG